MYSLVASLFKNSTAVSPVGDSATAAATPLVAVAAAAAAAAAATPLVAVAAAIKVEVVLTPADDDGYPWDMEFVVTVGAFKSSFKIAGPGKIPLGYWLELVQMKKYFIIIRQRNVGHATIHKELGLYTFSISARNENDYYTDGVTSEISVPAELVDPELQKALDAAVNAGYIFAESK